MFVDEVKVFFQGGRGGNGCSSTLRQKYIPRGGPDGGNGGRGGSVTLVASPALNTLSSFTHQRHFRAHNGKNGSSNNKYGHSGEDCLVPVPLGTVVRTDEGEIVADLLLVGETYVAARGGRGGKGNRMLATQACPVPHYAEKGEPGEESWLRLELKLLADVGLIGFPNVGKSTFISRTTAARPTIADYPFTTTVPHLGVVDMDGKRQFVLADIPGLIEGAHEGKGLGIRFLRHIERCRMLVHVLDLSGFTGRDPVVDYRTVRKELASYSPRLAEKPEIIVGNKLDVPDSNERLTGVKKRLRKRVYGVSAVTGEGVVELLRVIEKTLEGLPKGHDRESIVHRFSAEPDFVVARCEPGLFSISGRRVETLVAMTDLGNEEAVEVLGRKLRRLGLDEELLQEGARPGDRVRIGRYEFCFQPD